MPFLVTINITLFVPSLFLPDHIFAYFCHRLAHFLREGVPKYDRIPNDVFTKQGYRTKSM